MRQVLSTALVALIVGSLAGVTVSALAQEPAQTSPDDAITTAGVNADTVDGRHAVAATNKKSQRRNKLVATDAKGLLPGNIVKPKWPLIQNKPAAFDDGQITWDEIQNKPALGGGAVAWGDIQGTPAGFADGTDNEGVTGVKVKYMLSDTVTVNGNQTQGGGVGCPSGSLVIGGGVFSNAASVLRMRQSFPSNTNGWWVTMTNESGTVQDFYVSAICLLVEPGGSLTKAAKSGVEVSTRRKAPVGGK